jgi:hypothetical protein
MKFEVFLSRGESDNWILNLLLYLVVTVQKLEWSGTGLVQQESRLTLKI